MMWVLLVFVLGGPRVGGLVWWLLAPTRWDLTFGGYVVPTIGLVLFPWTTVVWVVVAPGGIGLWGTFLIVFGFVLDLASYGGGGRVRRSRGW